MKKIFTFLFLTLFVCTQIIASGSNEEASDGSVTLNVMHHYTKEEASTDNTRKVPRETFLSYEDMSDVDLSITEIQHNEYETKLQALAAADNLPDVFTAKGSWIPNFVDNEMIADISDAVNDCEWLDEYRDGL
jgi:ABC-type glycerol-3-phosphate transport system substrate-binding protein